MKNQKIIVIIKTELTAKNDGPGKLKCSKNANNLAMYQPDTVRLIKNNDKYDLELNFKPRHRQHIAEAKNKKTFQLWDKQTQDKYGFIPLGDQILPEKNKINLDMRKFHQAVKNSNKYNFMDAQIEVPSQLNPDVWEDHLTEYWDKQLCFFIRYGFSLRF